MAASVAVPGCVYCTTVVLNSSSFVIRQAAATAMPSGEGGVLSLKCFRKNAVFCRDWGCLLSALFLSCKTVLKVTRKQPHLKETGGQTNTHLTFFYLYGQNSEENM